MEKFPLPTEKKTEEREHAPLKKVVIAGLGIIAFTSFLKQNLEDSSTDKKGSSDAEAEEFLEERLTYVSETDNQSFASFKNHLVQRVGLKPIADLFVYEEEAKRPHQEKPKEIVVSGFEQSGIVSNNDVVKMMDVSFPTSWLHRSVTSVLFQPAAVLKEKGQQYAYYDGQSGIVIQAMDTAPTFTEKESQRYATIGMLRETLAHEICHANDWRTKNPRTFLERVTLLKEIVDRVESKDPYEERKVEGITHHLLDGYADAASKNKSYREYFADICSKYILDPSGLNQTNPQDYRIVDEWVKKDDASFGEKLPPGPFSPTTGKILPEWKNIFN